MERLTGEKSGEVLGWWSSRHVDGEGVDGIVRLVFASRIPLLTCFGDGSVGRGVAVGVHVVSQFGRTVVVCLGRSRGRACRDGGCGCMQYPTVTWKDN